MAEPQEHKTLSLSEQYALKDKDEKVVAEAKPVEVKEVDSLAATDPEEVVTEKPEEQPAATESTENTSPVAAVEESGDSSPPAISEETAEADPPASETTTAEESSDNAENPPAEEEAQEEAPEIKLETAPADFRFPTTNQTRHCFTRYVEYHRCVAAKGEGAPECDRFQKYYRALCPSEWVERWNEQRENGTFPGPL